MPSAGMLPLIRGALVGLATCLTFGPVTIAVMRAGFERRIAAAIACGAGAAIVDVVESQLAYLGMAELLRAVPGAIPFLSIAGGVVLLASGLHLTRRRGAEAARVDLAAGSRAFLQGLFLTALNPAALLGWIALAGGLFADLGRGRALLASAGVGIGVWGWFVLIAWLSLRGSSLLGARARIVTRVLDVLLACAGVYLVVRGALGAIRG
jgi:leucine efflux protein